MTERNSFDKETWEALEKGEDVVLDLRAITDMAALQDTSADWRCSYVARASRQSCCLPKGHTEPHHLVDDADLRTDGPLSNRGKGLK